MKNQETPAFESWKPPAVDLQKARRYADEATWLLLEALRALDCKERSDEERALLQSVRSKVMTARQFMDMAIRNMSDSLSASGSTNYVMILPEIGLVA